MPTWIVAVVAAASDASAAVEAEFDCQGFSIAVSLDQALVKSTYSIAEPILVGSTVGPDANFEDGCYPHITVGCDSTTVAGEPKH